MKKNPVLLIFLVLLIGCTGGGIKQKQGDSDFHTGTQGIVMQLVPNAPPSKVYEGDNLVVSVELFNKGAWPETGSFQGKLEISGFDTSAISGSWDGGNNLPAKLMGKSMYNPTGGYDIMDYSASGVSVPFGADSYPADIIVHSCYRYRTHASPIMCIDPTPYEAVSERKVCSVGNKALSGGQGAPVAVTLVEEDVSVDTIYFKIHFKNMGDGTVISSSSYNKCPFDLKYEDINKITVNIDTSFDTGPRCTPAGTLSDPVNLINGEGFIFCSFRKPNARSAYETPLNIEAEYVYASSISKQFEIINVN
jgi:hypothetical protein